MESRLLFARACHSPCIWCAWGHWTHGSSEHKHIPEELTLPGVCSGRISPFKPRFIDVGPVELWHPNQVDAVSYGQLSVLPPRVVEIVDNLQVEIQVGHSFRSPNRKRVSPRILESPSVAFCGNGGVSSTGSTTWRPTCPCTRRSS